MTAPSTRPAHVGRSFTVASLGGLAMLAVVVIAAIALLVFLPPPDTGPPDANGAPTTAASATVEPSASLDPTSTPPTAGERPTPSSPPVAPARWAGLTWSEPVTPPVTMNLADVVPWEDGYAAVGRVAPGDVAFLTSPDGVSWTIAQREAASLDRYPRHLIGEGGSLLAFSEPRWFDDSAARIPLIWRSSDGASWSLVDSPSWAAAWSGHLFIDVASGPAGLVAIGNAPSGAHGELLYDAIVVHSADGVTWTRAVLDAASEHSVVSDIVGFEDGYALLGGEHEGPTAGIGPPRAWYSTDGRGWSQATMIGADDGDNQFAAQSGFASGGRLVARTELGCIGCPPVDFSWVSTDGAATWHRAAEVGSEPPYGIMAGDGSRLVILATKPAWTPIGDDPEPYPGLSLGWVSTDATTWAPLTLSQPMIDPLERWWVLPDGVLFAGVQSFWFGTPVIAP
jgi:hypothetical protein